MPALVALHRPLGLGTEDAVGGNAERLLECPHVVLGLRCVGPHVVPLGDGVARREPTQCDRGEHRKQTALGAAFDDRGSTWGFDM